MTDELTSLQRIKKVFQTAKTLHCGVSELDSDNVIEISDTIAALEVEINALQTRVDGYHPINKSPSLGDWVLVRFVPGFIQPYKAVQYLEDKFGNRHFGPHMDRQIDRWWPAGEVR